MRTRTHSAKRSSRRLLLLLAVAVGAVVCLAPGGQSAGAPAAPNGLTGLALGAKVELSWQTVSGASGYTVYRGTSASNVTTAITGNGAVGSTTYIDSTAANNTTYYYAVRAVATGLSSNPSTLTEATPRALTCSSGNAIVVENCFPGSTGWKTTNATDAAHGGIEGYLTATSVQAGGSVDLKVNTAANAAYHVEIYRTGWYGGSQGRLVSILPGLHGIDQPDCATDDTTGLVDCSNWAVTSTIVTTSDWPSGVYILRLVRDDNGTDNQMILVVRHDGGTGVEYDVPVSTYQAYNGYLGRSLYDFNSYGDNTVAGTPRAVEVSYDRPYQEPVDGLRNFYTFADIQAVSWLEHQGYDITYTTSVDMKERPTELLSHKMIISGAHDEYWSSEMRTAATNARNAGTSLLFLGANEVYWKIRYIASPSSGVADRVQVCYKTTQSGPADPSGTPTGTWRDPAGANQPENALAGEQYIGDNDDEFYPLVVSATQGQNRVWRFTSLATMSPGDSASIGQNLVGWEWDARASNGQEPAGVSTFAASPVTGEELTDAGKTYTNGPATQQSVEYKYSSGAYVYATGTNQWDRGLGYDATGVGEPSALIAQATMNMLADGGVLPTTPQSGLVVDSTAPPTVSSTTPTNGATNVSALSNVTATFGGPVDPSTVNTTTFTLTGPSGAVAGTVSYDGSSSTASFTPNAALTAGANYTAKVTTGVKTWTGTPMASAVTWSFTVASAASCPCSLLTGTTPSLTHLPAQDGRSGSGPFTLELGIKIQVSTAIQLSAIRYYKDSQETGTHIGRVWSSTGTLLGSATFTNETASGWQQQILSNPVLLQPGTTYVVSVNSNSYFVDTPAGLQNKLTNGVLASVADGQNGVYALSAGTFPSSSYNSSNYFVDAVVGSLASGPPQVTSTVPAGNATDVSTTAPVTATFSTAMDPTTLTTTTFSLSGPSGTVAGAVSYDSTSKTATFTPSSALTSGATYTATISTGAKSSSGTALASAVTWSFVTSASTATCPCSLFANSTPSLTHLSVADGRSGTGPFTYEMGIKVQVSTAAQLTALRFYKDSGETGTHIGRVWSSTGTQLAQVTFTGESASGWQQQNLSSPVSLQAGTTYVISVNQNTYFVDTPGGLQNRITNGVLSSIADGANGVFGNSAGTFPTSSYNSSNYFIDGVVGAVGAVPLTVSATSPASGAGNQGSKVAASATFSTGLNPSTLTTSTFSLSGPSGAIAGSVSYDSNALAATFTPTQPLAPGTTYTATISTGLKSTGGVGLSSPYSWSFTTSNCPCSLIPAVLAPSLTGLSVSDGRSGAGPFTYEMGMKIQVSSPSQLTGIRFYKDSQETGTHTGTLWSTSGQLQLGQVTFTNETASGWQQANFSTPITLQPGVTYIVSVNMNNTFVDTPAGLQSSLTNGQLSSVADGQNGVFAAAAGTFPSSSYNSSNYFVDAIVQ